MDSNTLEEIFSANDERLYFKNKLPERDKLISIIHFLTPTTGILRNMFCNSFMQESVEMIRHSFFLYEEGLFDCAFYSLRQSIEILNSMLLCVDDEEKLNSWKAKDWFPMDSKVKQILESQNNAYKEIKTKIPEFFEDTEICLNQANKYIHKQGFDTFYVCHWVKTDLGNENCLKLYLKLMKQAIGMVLIMNIALDPLSLALSDQDVKMYIPFAPLTEPIPIQVFEEILSIEVLEKIKETQHYKELKEYFLSQERLSKATYEVIYYQYFDIQNLKEIEKQRHLLDLEQGLILDILLAGINASYFYPQNYIPFGYATSYTAKTYMSSWSSNQFDEFLSEPYKKNISWKNMYISIFSLFDSYLIIQHNDIFKSEEIHTIEVNVNIANQKYNEYSKNTEKMEEVFS